jgi:hypothetical protein
MKRLMLTIGFVSVLLYPLFGQSIEPPTNWLALFANINVWLGSLAGVAAVTVFLAAFLNTLFKTTGFMKQLVAWAVGFILMIVGNLVNLGFMAELNWLNTVIYGFAAGLISNGIFDIELIKMILRALGIEKEV